MNLLQGMRLTSDARLALVGAGGKTTTMFQLARQYLAMGVGSVLLTATTHLSNAQTALADSHSVISSTAQIEKISDNLPQGAVLFTGSQVEDERLAGLSGQALAGLCTLATERHLPLLVEADGSRRRPLKAPAGHEPPIPDWVDAVLVVAGLSGLGKPLNANWVHRPERFSELSGLVPGEPVTLEAIQVVLAHPLGGLKNIPQAARRICLLSQAETPELQSAGARLARGLLRHGYAAAFVSGKPGMGTVFEPAAGIVLAAGGSSRLGTPKQLLTWQGETLVKRAARLALEAGLSPVVVVTGAHAAEVGVSLAGLPVVIAHNPAWASGQSSSLITGLKALPPETGSALFLLADQPLATPDLVGSLVERHAGNLAPIVAPFVAGQRGNPVLFDRQTFPDLLALQGDSGGRALFARYPIDWLPWHDERILLDIDRPGDYERLLALAEAG